MGRLKTGVRATLLDFVPVNGAGGTLDVGGIAGMADTGENVGDATALNISAYWRGLSLISTSEAMLPLHLFRRSGRGKERADDHPLYDVLHRRPNPRMTSFTWRQTMAAHRIMWGNAFSFKEKNARGIVTALWPMNPARMTVQLERLTDAQIRARVQPRVRYRYVHVNGQEVVYEADAIHHIRGLSPDGLVGYPVLTLMRHSLGLARAGEKAQSSVFKNAARPSVVLVHPTTLPQGKREELADDWQTAYSGTANTGRVAILEDGMKLVPFGFPPEDAEFLATRTFQVLEFARWLGVPPHKLYELTRATFSNIEQQALEYLTDSLNGGLVNWEQQMLLDLLDPERAMDDDVFPEFDRNGLMQADMRARAFFYQTMRSIGVFNADDIAARENINELPDELGKRYFVPANWMELIPDQAAVPLSGPRLVSEPAAADQSVALEVQDLNDRVEQLEYAAAQPLEVPTHSHRNGSNGSQPSE